MAVKDESGSFEGAMNALNLDLKDIEGNVEAMDYPQLAAAKDTVEQNLTTLFDLLQNKYNCDMSLPLVVDGFPRADIDVVSVRLIRLKIVRLRNDHSQIMSLLETKLAEYFARAPKIEDTPPVETTEPLTPFAVVKSVANESPAERAGLREGDQIVLFDDDINAHNHRDLAAIVPRVTQKKDAQIPVRVRRGSTEISLNLKPTDRWAGRGLLGCHIVPI